MVIAGGLAPGTVAGGLAPGTRTVVAGERTSEGVRTNGAGSVPANESASENGKERSGNKGGRSVGYASVRSAKSGSARANARVSVVGGEIAHVIGPGSVQETGRARIGTIVGAIEMLMRETGAGITGMSTTVETSTSVAIIVIVMSTTAGIETRTRPEVVVTGTTTTVAASATSMTVAIGRRADAHARNGWTVRSRKWPPNCEKKRPNWHVSARKRVPTSGRGMIRKTSEGLKRNGKRVAGRKEGPGLPPPRRRAQTRRRRIPGMEIY